MVGIFFCGLFCWHVVALVSVAFPVSQLQIVQVITSASCTRDYVVNCWTKRIRIFQRLVNRLSANPTDCLCCKYYLFVVIKHRPPGWITLWSLVGGRSVFIAPPGHIFCTPWAFFHKGATQKEPWGMALLCVFL